MDLDSIKKIEGVLDVNRTNELFDSSIKRSSAHKEGEYDENDIKKQRIVIGFGNLHLNTSRVKMSAIRLIGYTKSKEDTKNAVQRKIRSARRSG